MPLGTKLTGDALDQALYDGTATVHCPKCDSTSIRERNVSEVWARIPRWSVDDGNELVAEDVSVDDSGDFERLNSTDEEPLVCYDCQWFGSEGALIVRVKGETPPVVEWTAEDNERADAEGWGMFNFHEIQRDDVLDIFATDQAVWHFLARRAAFGSDEYARKALLWVRQECPEESAHMWASVYDAVDLTTEIGGQTVRDILAPLFAEPEPEPETRPAFTSVQAADELPEADFYGEG
jgi:hypothetical protein